MRCEVLTAVTVTVTVSWGMMPYNLVAPLSFSAFTLSMETADFSETLLTVYDVTIRKTLIFKTNIVSEECFLPECYAVSY